jgi:TonB family protein
LNNALVVVVVSACGGAAHRVPYDAATIARATSDPASIERMLGGSVTNGGLWFDDSACAAQFGAPEVIKRDRFAAFARCLSGLHLQASPRVDELPDVVVLTYSPGFEIEARIIEDRSGPRLTWIGYESRTNEDALVPTVSVAALEAHRIAGDRTVALAPEVANTLTPAVAWLKVCVDPEGVITIQSRDVSPVKAQHALAEAATAWKFRPFVVRDRAIAVCAMVRLVYPPEPVAVTETLPVPIPPSRLADPPEVVAPTLLETQRIAGSKLLIPDDATKDDIMRSGRHTVTAAYKLCIDERGRVESIHRIKSSGYLDYDREIVEGMRAWAYRPLVVAGKPIPVCTSFTFIYTQH